MKGSTLAVVALGVGYVLGRKRKLRAAMIVAVAAAVGGPDLGSRAILRGAQSIGSTDAFGEQAAGARPQRTPAHALSEGGMRLGDIARRGAQTVGSSDALGVVGPALGEVAGALGDVLGAESPRKSPAKKQPGTEVDPPGVGPQARGSTKVPHIQRRDGPG